MKIDIFTMVIVLSITNFLQVIALFLQYRVNEAYKGVGWWLLGFTSMSSGYIFLFLRGIIAVKMISIILANALILAGTVFLYIGVMRFFDKKENSGLIISIFSVYLLSFIYFTYFNDYITSRTVIIYGIVGAVSFLIAWSIFFYKTVSVEASANFNTVLFFTQGCFFSFRSIITIAADPVESLFTPAMMQAISFVFLFISGILVTFGLIIMLNQRLNSENSEDKENLELFFNTNPDSVLITQIDDGFFIRVNEGFSTLTGYTRKDVTGKSSLEINLWKYPEDRLKVVSALRERGICENLEVVFQRKDGTPVTGLISAKIINIQGVPHIMSVTRDISDRKRIETALRESELKYRSLIENTSDVVFCVNEKGEYQFANNVFASTFGQKPEYFIGKTFWDVYPKEHADYRQETNRQVFETGEARSLEVTVPLPDRIMYFLAKANPIKDENGIVVMNLTTATDITARKEAEKALHDSEEKFRQLVENSHDIIYTLTSDGIFTFVSPAWTALLGHPLNQVVGQSFVPFVHPDDVPACAEWLKKVIETGERQEGVEYRVCHLDGTWCWHTSSAVPLRNESGTVIGFEGTARDITESKHVEEALRESEEKLNTLFSSMTEMVVLHELVFDEKGEAVNYRITDCNNAFTAITGIEKSDASGKLATDVFQTGTAPFIDEYARVATTGVPYEYTTYFEPLDKYFSVSAVSPKKNNFATITTDITGIREIQNEIFAKNEELENYLYIASHDLRSPLVNIQGFSRRLQKHADSIKTIITDSSISPGIKSDLDHIIDEDIPKSLKFIFASVTKMDTLLAGLLHLSRTGRTLMSIKKIDTSQLLHTIIGNYNFQLTELNAIVNISDLPPCYGDENLLNQLFSNIIGNAIKYRDKSRQLIIEITAGIEYRRVVYSMRDNGSGIDQRHLEKIWDIFYKVDSSQPDTGDGLGLSIVKRIAEKHNGRVRVESEPGKGSTFFVELQRFEFTE